MEGSSLFNPGVVGQGFNWWIGQIADDSTWRDNILPGKFESKDSIPGWGRRYKVRIMGLHDQGQDSVPDDQLPWANIMYPVTAGGGQTNSFATSGLRQGMFVFGFFMDGPDQQTPIIMGAMGNNAQTALSTKIGDNKVTNTTPGSLATSGYAEGKEPPKGTAKPQVPAEGLVVTKPKKPEQSKECAAAPPGTQLNKFGLRPDLPLTRPQLTDAQNARAQAEINGLEGQAKEDYVMKSVSDGMKNRCGAANAPTSRNEPGATKENPDATHELNAGDVQREDKYREKIVLMKPDDVVGSAIKAIQTEIDNLTQKLDKFLASLSAYIDAVSIKKAVTDIEKLMKDTSEKISKYMKVIMDKVMEYVQKTLNAELTKTVSSMPSSMRYMFGDQKYINTQMTTGLYNGITNGMGGLLGDILAKALDFDNLVKEAQAQAGIPSTLSGPSGPSSGGGGGGGTTTQPIGTPKLVNGVMRYWGGPQYLWKTLQEYQDLLRDGKIVGPAIPGSTTTTTTTGNNTVTTQTNPNPTGSQSSTQSAGTPFSSADSTTITVDQSGASVGGGSTTARLADANRRKHPKVPMCYAEDIVGQVISASRGAINEANGKMLMNYNRFLGDVQSQLEEADEKLRPRAVDTSDFGKVIEITDEEAEDNVQGGSGYVTEQGVTAIGGDGGLLTVDIVVPRGGFTASHYTIDQGGTNYSAGQQQLVATGGSGSGCKVNVVTVATVSGVGTGIAQSLSVHTAGSNYTSGDVLSLPSIGGGTQCQFTLDKVIGKIDKIKNGGIIVDVPGHSYQLGNLMTVAGGNGDATFTIIQTKDPGKKKATPGPFKASDNEGTAFDQSSDDIGQKLGGMMGMLGGMVGNMASALNFENISLDIFPFELPPNPAVSDYYQFATGGSGIPDTGMPSVKAIQEAADRPPKGDAQTEIDFAQPTPDSESVDLTASDVTYDMDSGSDDPDYDPNDYLDMY